MKIALYPFKHAINAYIAIMEKIIVESDYEVCNLKKVIKNLKELNQLKIVNFNWFDIIHSNSLISCIIKLFGKILLVYFLRLKNIKIVFTVHNKIGHDSKHANFDIRFFKFLCMNSDALIIHSQETQNILKQYLSNANYKKIKNKITFIPHPNYTNVYPENNKDLRKILHISDRNMIILFIGAIRPYKNIELIIDIANEMNDKQVTFIIAGSVSIDYKVKIESLIKTSNNIRIVPQFIKDDEITAYIKASDILILPYNTVSSLNSGTCILAFSFGKSVICPLIGTLKDYNEKFFYAYEYSSMNDHREKLFASVKQAYEDFHDHHDLFLSYQKKAFQLAMTYHDYKVIQQKYKILYDELSGEINKGEL